jgi:hypothetical protein
LLKGGLCYTEPAVWAEGLGALHGYFFADS